MNGVSNSMPAGDLYIAVDLGAGSGRVFLCGFDDALTLEEIHRFQYPPRVADGHLRWDFTRIFGEIVCGLKRAAARAAARGGRVRSLGVDSWAVDYGLLDRNGRLLADPVCYRDARTDGVMARVFEKIPRRSIFEKTGIQFQNFNTLYQLCAEHETLERADKLLLLPDLVNYFLTGRVVAEYTNATTTQLLDAARRTWDEELCERLSLPFGILPEIVPAGTDLGPLKPELATETGLEGARVVAPATHDTASAVAGAPLEDGWAYISSGTWSLVGVELDRPLVGERVARENFTNEGGACGTYRFLKNVMGLWILESCRREWQARGIAADYATLFAETERVPHFRGFIFPDDERFFNPADMIGAMNLQMSERGEHLPDRPGEICRIVLDSLAFRYASVLRTIEDLTGRKPAGVRIVGGGARNRYLNRMTANASGLKVVSGPVEATVTGNALVQAIAAGRFRDLAEARGFVRQNTAFEEFEPAESAALNAMRNTFEDVEEMYRK